MSPANVTVENADQVPPHTHTARPSSVSGRSVASSTTIASLILGVVGLVAWLLPIVGFPVALIGLVLGLVGRQQLRGTWATAALGICAIGLALTAVNSGLGAYAQIGHDVIGAPRFMVLDGSQEIDVPLFQVKAGESATVPVSAIFRNAGGSRGSQIADFYLRDAEGRQMGQCTATTAVTNPGVAMRAGCNENVKFLTFYAELYRLDIILGTVQTSE